MIKKINEFVRTLNHDCDFLIRPKKKKISEQTNLYSEQKWKNIKKKISSLSKPFEIFISLSLLYPAVFSVFFSFLLLSYTGVHIGYLSPCY